METLAPWFALLFAILSTTHVQAGEKKATKVKEENLKYFLKTRKDASAFEPESPTKRLLNKENVREECCVTDCSFEERAEFSEDHSWEWLGDRFCELSIKDSHSCQCRARAGFNYECGVNLPCNMRVSLSNNIGGPNYGNVLIGGYPVCDEKWGEAEAKVACRELGYDMTKTRAVPTKGSRFGDVSSIFRGDASCKGTESVLNKCLIPSSNSCANDPKRGAGVYCIILGLKVGSSGGF